MQIVSTSYSKTEEYASPVAWLDRINFYTGILEELALQHKVDSIERINFEGQLRKNNVDYHFQKIRNTVARFPWRMHRMLKALQPDVILVNGFIFPLQIIQLRVTVGSRAKIFVLHRSEKPFTGIKKWLQVAADRCVDAYLFSSAEFGKQWIAGGIISSEKKILECIPASSFFKPENKSVAREKLGIKGNPLYVWAGRLEKNKDPITVVRAFIKFHGLHPAAKLYMIFQSDELLEDVQEMIRAAGAAEGIDLVGKVAHEQMQSWFSAADFVISGSHYEGGGIAIAEAMSCGCIPLVTDIVSFRKIAGDCGFLYEPGNAEELFQILVRSLGVQIPGQQMKVLAKFEEELSFAAIAKKINHHILNGSK